MEVKTIGADPELFLVDKKGQFKSAIGIIPGNKYRPSPVKELGKGFAIQADNVLCEFNIPTAPLDRTKASLNRFLNNNLSILKYLKDYLSPHGLDYAVVASAQMPEEELTHPDAHVFGCEPDYNVWELQNNPPPDKTDPLLRSAGGHIHIGGKMTQIEGIILGRWLDINVSAPLAALDKDVNRRKLYGKAGCIRFKPYGIEYRTPSNFWLSSDNLIAQTYERVFHCAERIKKGARLTAEASAAAIQAINEGNQQALDRLYATKATSPYSV